MCKGHSALVMKCKKKVTFNKSNNTCPFRVNIVNQLASKALVIIAKSA